MGNLFAYVIEQLLVHSPDALIVGGGYYLIRFTSKIKWGGVCLLLYAMAIVGMMTTETDEFSWWRPIAAIVGCFIAELIGRRREKKRRTEEVEP